MHSENYISNIKQSTLIAISLLQTCKPANLQTCKPANLQTTKEKINKTQKCFKSGQLARDKK